MRRIFPLPKPVSGPSLTTDQEDSSLLHTTAQPSADHRAKTRVTISDLAQALGVTKGTVSRALNGYPDISEATRLRVRRKAEEMGYAPMAHAQAIRTGRVRALGLVLQIGEPDAQRPFLADFLAGITSGASAEDWTLTVANAASDAEMLATMRRLTEERKADGFILPRTRLDDPRVNLLREARVPFVLYGRVADPTGCAWYDIRSEDATTEAIERLHGLGHRRIGYIGGGHGYTYSRLRRGAYDQAVARLGLPDDPTLAVENAVTIEQGTAAARQLLGAPCPPTAIFCATDMVGIGALRAIAALGLTAGGMSRSSPMTASPTACCRIRR